MAYKIMLPSFTVTRTLFKTVHSNGTSGPSFHFDEDGEETLYCRVEYDPERLAIMCRGAAGNKAGTSNDGPLRVTVVSRKRTQPPVKG